MKVLVIGGGGREHAIAWKLSKSRQVDKIFCAPGNAGIAQIAECIDLNPLDFDAILDFVKYEWIDLTIAGPEEPLSRGMADAFLKAGRRFFGPVQAGAQIESSKAYSKDFMKKYGIPTAEYRTFTSYTQAVEYLRLKGAPIVVKADGLAAGKGVFVANTYDEAMDALKVIMKERAFGDAGNRVILEQCLQGEEASFMAIVDGESILPLESSQDHKRALDGDEGPNTGGMGAYSPAPVVTDALKQKIMDKVMLPALRGFKAEGIDYKGVLYAGIMVNNGEPSVLEFNCRLGDPETQPVLSRLKTDLVDICIATAGGRLSEVQAQWEEGASVCIVAASGGYPGTYKKGYEISGLQQAGALSGVNVFHSGTTFKDGMVVTSGGRVLGVTALGDTVDNAISKAYEAMELIKFKGMHYRKDIGKRALNRQEAI